MFDYLGRRSLVNREFKHSGVARSLVVVRDVVAEDKAGIAFFADKGIFWWMSFFLRREFYPTLTTEAFVRAYDGLALRAMKVIHNQVLLFCIYLY